MTFSAIECRPIGFRRFIRIDFSAAIADQYRNASTVSSPRLSHTRRRWHDFLRGSQLRALSGVNEPAESQPGECRRN
jgi:hypothetical protein